MCVHIRAVSLLHLIYHLRQSAAVSGAVNLTCDAWQASNSEGYFAVTGHWIEESTPSNWELKSALLGFTRLNNAHNGMRLGQALYKIVQRVGIAHKVRYILLLSLSSSSENRLAISHAITQKTTERCWKNLLFISRRRRRRNFPGESAASSKFQWFSGHLFCVLMHNFQLSRTRHQSRHPSPHWHL